MIFLNIWAIFFLKISFFEIVSGEFTGFYIDNGIGQTILEESIPQADAHFLRQNILELLELPDQSNTERFPSVIRYVFLFFCLHNEKIVSFNRKREFFYKIM